jgi:hypothetical protein
MLCGSTNAVEPDLEREQLYEERLLLELLPANFSFQFDMILF